MLILSMYRMSNKILISGTGGFIGKNIKRYLMSKNYKVIDYKKNCQYKNVTKFIHLQFFISKKKNRFYKKNLLLTKEITSFCIKHNLELIFLSTHLPLKTSNKIKYNEYQQAKIDSEEWIKKNFYKKNINYKILRLPNVYGNGCLYGIIPDLIKNMKKKKLTIKNSEKFRDFIFIDDLVKIIFKLIWIKKSFQLFLGTGKKTKIKTIVEKIKFTFSYNCKIIYSGNDNDIYKLNFGNRTLKKIIGNYKFINIDKGLKKMLGNI